MSDATTLLPRQSRFVDEYLIDRNAPAAAIRAGYSERCALIMAARLLRQEQVRKAVKARAARVPRRLNITREDCIKGLVEAYKVARATQDGRAMVGAIRELNKMLGFYAPRRPHLGDTGCQQL